MDSTHVECWTSIDHKHRSPCSSRNLLHDKQKYTSAGHRLSLQDLRCNVQPFGGSCSKPANHTAAGHSDLERVTVASSCVNGLRMRCRCYSCRYCIYPWHILGIPGWGRLIEATMTDDISTLCDITKRLIYTISIYFSTLLREKLS